MHNIITDLFRLQVEWDFTLNFRWVHPATSSAEADGLSRPGADDYARLRRRKIGRIVLLDNMVLI